MKSTCNGGGLLKVLFCFLVSDICLMGVQVQAAITIADSVADFEGTQGYKRWYYGWGLPGSESNSAFNSTFTNNLGYYNGSGTWLINVSNSSPQLTSTGGHPGWEGETYGYWAIRRYVSPVAGLVRLSGSSQHDQIGDGDGTAARLYIDDLQIYTKLMASNGVTAGPVYNYAITLKVNLGSTISMAIDNRYNSNSDFTQFKLKVETLPLRRLVADSRRDFNYTGTQPHADADGRGTWQYGDRSGSVFSTNGWEYHPGWYAWTNSGYRLLSGWGQHPYLTNSVLVTRRWTSGLNGQIIIDGGIRKTDEVNSGDGVIVAVVLNGTSTLYTATLNGVTNLAGIGETFDVDSRLFTLTNQVVVGSTLDFTIGPQGNAYNDSTDLYVTITREVLGSLFIVQ